MDKPSYNDLPAPMHPDEVPKQNPVRREREVIIIGGGMAGLSAAIYLGRALRDVLVIDAGESLAMWEPEVQNYLGFPGAIDGCELLKRGRKQAEQYHAELLKEEIDQIRIEDGRFRLKGRKCEFEALKLLLATGVYHLPPKIPAVNECTGISMFFCKDCDGFRVQGKRVIIAGHNNEAVEYALAILAYTGNLTLLTNGQTPRWDQQHARWLQEYEVPVALQPIEEVDHLQGRLQAVRLAGGQRLDADAIFTTRGDIFHNQLAQQLGARMDEEGQIVVDSCQRTSVPGLYAAGCVTPANCQMIIAAGDGATAAQAINRDLFEESLANGSLKRHRAEQLAGGWTAEKLAVS